MCTNLTARTMCHKYTVTLPPPPPHPPPLRILLKTMKICFNAPAKGNFEYNI
jgi:hypothetical protein